MRGLGQLQEASGTFRKLLEPSGTRKFQLDYRQTDRHTDISSSRAAPSQLKTEPDVGVSWLVIIEHMESVTGALLVVNVSVLDAMCLKIIFLISTLKKLSLATLTLSAMLLFSYPIFMSMIIDSANSSMSSVLSINYQSLEN